MAKGAQFRADVGALPVREGPNPGRSPPQQPVSEQLMSGPVGFRLRPLGSPKRPEMDAERLCGLSWRRRDRERPLSGMPRWAAAAVLVRQSQVLSAWPGLDSAGRLRGRLGPDLHLE